jgi:hypothetical protein
MALGCHHLPSLNEPELPKSIFRVSCVSEGELIGPSNYFVVVYKLGKKSPCSEKSQGMVVVVFVVGELGTPAQGSSDTQRGWPG